MALTSEKKSIIWNTLNDTRGKVSPTVYKNYIFGIMFYKFLSEKAQDWLATVSRGESWKNIWNQDSVKAAEFMQKKLGYVIQPGDMFSDWKQAIDEDKFNIMMISDALTRFEQGIREDARDDFAGIFSDMDLTSTGLGNNAQTRTATMIDWIELINKMEMDEDSDVLGDLYEYLIGMFAANSGAKAGEFYTPHEVSDVMARILTHGREDKENYSLYDPTLGSGSLLLTTASYMKNAGTRGAIKYYGQELITATYNLARMNLIMNNIEYNDIRLNNADTLNNDWPDGVVDGVNSPRMFDAVMANPPYSQKWVNTDRGDDPRFKMGVAPKSKADYAFLLHGLYHLKQDGRMAIVLPHGVLFRGGTEGKIRQNLLENHNISTIIGIPAKIFTNTGIPTVIMILEKNRVADDVLFIDASKGFEKQKSNNKLRQTDIDKIVDTYIKREDVDKYAHVATLDEIKENDFNLNIPRYVDTFEEEPPVDVDKLVADIQTTNQEIAEQETKFTNMLAELVGQDPDAQQQLEKLKELFK